MACYTYGGKFVINPSGGLISKGHPLGATGIAQCAELCWQLRNQAGDRQVPNAKLALQHNIGLGGAVVVTLYRLGFPDKASSSASSTVLNPPKDIFKLKSAKFFTKAFDVLTAAESAIDKKIKGSIKFNVSDTSSNYVASGGVRIENGKVDVSFDPNFKGECTISIPDDVLNDILCRKTTPEKAFFAGKLKLQGNIGFVTRLMSMKNLLLSKL